MSKNIDFIICDHHLPDDVVPDAVAILNPKQKDCNYPYKELCGCGVGFKLITALAEKNGLPLHVRSFLSEYQHHEGTLISEEGRKKEAAPLYEGN